MDKSNWAGDREFRTELRGEVAGEWDLSRIRQALLNLIDNAVQHGSPDSAITVSVSGDTAGGEVIVSVRNLGVAIPDEARDRIFEPFQRGSPGEAAGEGDRGRHGLGLCKPNHVPRMSSSWPTGGEVGISCPTCPGT
jgi:signal transduction histidine kinase